MNRFLEKIIGDLEGKKEWRQTEARAKALPKEFSTAYNEIKKYIWTTSGIETITPLTNLVDLFEEAAANGKKVLDVIGSDVAAFADELVRGEKSYFEKKRQQLNKDISKKLGK